jgi:hypothetical protein
MKRIKILRAIALSLLTASVLAACTKSPEEKIVESGELLLDLTFTVSDETAISATFEITPSNAEIPYYWSAMPEADYRTLQGDHDALKNEDMDYLRDEAEKASVSLDEMIGQRTARGSIRKTLSGLIPDTDYIAYGYALSGNQTGKVSTLRFSTNTAPPPLADLTLTVSARMTQVDVNVTPESRDVIYFTNFFDDADYQEYGGTTNGLLACFEDNVAIVAGDSDMTREEFLSLNVKRGTFQRTHRYLNPETTYWFFAIEFNSDYTIKGVTVEPATTTERQRVNTTIDIDISNVGQVNANYELTPSDKQQKYVWDLLPKSDYYVGGGNDEDFMRWFIGNWVGQAGSLDPLIVTGDQKGDFGYRLPTSTEFILVAFATDGETYLSDLYMEEFTTLAVTPREDVTFTLSLLARAQQRIVMSVVPSDNLVPYHFYMDTKANYDLYAAGATGAEADRKAVQGGFDAHVETWLDWYRANYPSENYTREMVIQGLLMSAGPHTLTEVQIVPDTEYYLWGGVFSADGTLLSKEPAVYHFKTLPYIVSAATIRPVLGNYFYAETVLGPLYEKQPTIAVIIDRVERSGVRPPTYTDDNGNEVEQLSWWYNFLSGDMTDVNQYPDYWLVSQMYLELSGRKFEDANPGQNAARDFKELKFLRRNAQGTMVAVAIDDAGNYGPVYRERFSMPQSGESPASLFPDGIFDDYKSPGWVGPARALPTGETPRPAGFFSEEMAKTPVRVSQPAGTLVAGKFDYSRISRAEFHAPEMIDMWRTASPAELRNNRHVRFSHRVR